MIMKNEEDKTIKVSDDTYNKIVSIAEKEDRTIKAVLERIFNNIKSSED